MTDLKQMYQIQKSEIEKGIKSFDDAIELAKKEQAKLKSALKFINKQLSGDHQEKTGDKV